MTPRLSLSLSNVSFLTASAYVQILPSYLSARSYTYMYIVEDDPCQERRFLHIPDRREMGESWNTDCCQKWDYGDQVKPQSDIRCNRFATSPRLTISTNRRGRNKVPDRSRRGCREVGDWSGTSLRPNQSLIWSQTGPGKVADQSPISRRLVADRSPTNFVRIGAWLSLKLVGDRSATNRGPLRDLTATSRRPVRNLF